MNLSKLACILFMLFGQTALAQNTNPWPSSGNVGIGTNTPDAILHVNGGIPMTSGWSRTSVLQATYPVQVFNSNSAKWAGLGYDYGHGMRFWVNATSSDVMSGIVGMSLSNAGNLGIGAFAPAAKLDVAGNIRLGDRLDNNSRFIGKGMVGADIDGIHSNWIGFPSTATQDYLTFGTHLSGVSGGERMRIDATGNVGIGTSSPAAPLHVRGGVPLTGGWNKTSVFEALYPVQIFNGNGTKWAGIGYDYSAAMRFWVNGSSEDVSGTALAALNILNNGNVGVGTTVPSEKLAVNGTIRSKEVRVEASPWPDYVFKADYKLKPLSEIESFVMTNHHLPEIPSAAKVAKEGIKLGEMDARLLQKIEELTLHLIEMNKRLQANEDRNQTQQREIETLKTKLRTL